MFRFCTWSKRGYALFSKTRGDSRLWTFYSSKLKISAFILYRVQMSRLSFLTTKNDLKVGSPKHLRITHTFSVHWDSREKKNLTDSRREHTTNSIQRQTSFLWPQGILRKLFSVLKKCTNKFDCLLYEMFLIQEVGPALIVQSDSIRAKVSS